MIALTIICENTAGPAYGVLGEHGFSVLVERDGRSLLFDTGQGRTIIDNASCLKKDLSRINRLVLSHGHYDHTGGFEHVLRRTGAIDVCAHPGIFTERYSMVRKGGQEIYRSAGLPFKRFGLEARGARFVFNTGFSEIEQGVYLTGEIPRIKNFEKHDARLKVRVSGGYGQDSVPDDQCLVIQSARGLIVVLGCAHSGLINTLNHIASQFPEQPFYAVIGGTHLGFLDDEQLQQTILELKGFNLQKIGVSHCTGQKAAMRLMQAFGDRFFFANAGSVLEVV